MSEGEPHPTARIKALSHTFNPGDGTPADLLEASITSSRLAVLRGTSDTLVAQVVVWDWTTGQVLFVRQYSYSSPTLIPMTLLGARGRSLPVREVC